MMQFQEHVNIIKIVLYTVSEGEPLGKETLPASEHRLLRHKLRCSEITGGEKKNRHLKLQISAVHFDAGSDSCFQLLHLKGPS